MQQIKISPAIVWQTTVSRIGLALAVLTASLGPSGAMAEEGPLQRWAIVADQAVQETGIADLLTVALADQQGVVLVEREHVAALLRELELTALLAAEGSDKRLELGRLLNADAIVTLSMVEGQPAQRPPGRDATERHVKLVVCESRFGARVRLEHLAYRDDGRETIVADLARIVAELREEYPQGVRQLIAVPHFLSRGLVRDHDHLQAGYTRLLEAALMGRQGLAVLETAEARAIRRELDLAGEARVQEAVVPWFVEGEFDVSSAAAEVEPAVRLAIRVWDGEAVRWETLREGMSLSDVPDFLALTVARQIAGLSGDGPPLDRRGLFGRIVARAAAFTTLAIHDHAAELREAALLLEPENFEQRLALIGDLYHWHPRPDREEYERQRQLYGQSRAIEFQRIAAEEGARRRREYLTTACQHLEYLLRRRTLNVIEADLIASRLLTQLQYYSTLYATDAPDVLAAGRAWFWRIYSLFPQLDPALAAGSVREPVAESMRGGYSHRPPQSALQQQKVLGESAARILLAEASRSRSPRWDQIADDYYRLLTEVADAELLLPLPSSPPGDDAQQARFSLRLIDSGQPANVFRGRLELLAMEVEGRRERRPWAELRGEWAELSARIDECLDKQPEYLMVIGPTRRRLAALDEEIRRAERAAPPEKRWPLPQNPVAPAAFGRRVVFEALEGVQPTWLVIEKCHASLDVAWGADRVQVIPAPGAMETIFRVEVDMSRASTARDGIYWVTWDGHAFWIACRRSGIHVVSPTGDRLGRVDQEQGLPPYEPGSHAPATNRLRPHPIALYPLAPGSCLAIGQTPVDRRLWFARIDLVPDTAGQATFAIDVFHTAVKEPAVPGAGTDDDPAERFVPSWLTEYRPPGSGPMLLVGRESRGGADARYGRPPLAIDLETLDVSFLPVQLPLRSDNNHLCQGVGGKLLVASNSKVELFEPGGAMGEAWQRRSLLEVEASGRSPRREPPLLPHEDQLVLPGNRWLVLNPQSWQTELLASPFVPGQQPFSRYGISAHYGVIGWNVAGTLYRFSIEPVPGASDGADAHYPFLPAEHREAHHRAAEAIRRLGGSVEVRWGHCPHLVPRPAGTGAVITPTTFPDRWRTTVYLPADWKGGDQGLSHLAGLYNPADLYLIRTPVSDAGMQTVGRVVSLESLYLVETDVTDTGLEHLSTLEELVYLRLEGAVGGEFSHRGLTHLSGLPKLRKLTLYGHGFTEAAVEPLEKFPALEELQLLDTQLPGAALEPLAAARRAAIADRRSPSAAFAPSPAPSRLRPFVFQHNPPAFFLD